MGNSICILFPAVFTNSRHPLVLPLPHIFRTSQQQPQINTLPFKDFLEMIFFFSSALQAMLFACSPRRSSLMAIDSNCGWETGFGRMRTFSGIILLPVLGTGLAGSYRHLPEMMQSLLSFFLPGLPPYKKNVKSFLRKVSPYQFYT